MFAAKNVSSFCNAKANHIFSAKNINAFAIFKIEILMSQLLSFEQLGPGPSCSKLTTSLVNDSLKFTLSDTQIC